MKAQESDAAGPFLRIGVLFRAWRTCRAAAGNAFAVSKTVNRPVSDRLAPWPENVSQCFPWRRSLSAEGAECQRYSPEDRQVRKRSGQMYNHAAHRNQYPGAQFQ